MWIAIWTAFFATGPLAVLFAGVGRLAQAIRHRRFDAGAGRALALVTLLLTGRWWLRLLRPSSDDEPKPLTPARCGSTPGWGGVRLAWEEFGPEDAPALLLSHGWSLTHETWYYQKKALSQDFRVIVWDMRGCGQSETPADHDYSLRAFVSDLAAVFQATKAGRHPAGCVLAGHSLGAMILPLFTETCPEHMRQVRGLALLGGTDSSLLATMRGRRWLLATRRWFWEPLGRTMSRLPLPFDLLARLFWQMGIVHLALMFGMHMGRESRGQDDLVARHCAFFSMRAAGLGALSCFDLDARAAMSKIAVPVLLLTGACDVNMPPEIQRAMAARLQRPELVLLPDCGHLNLLECHNEVNQHLLAFARRVLNTEER